MVRPWMGEVDLTLTREVEEEKGKEGRVTLTGAICPQIFPSTADTQSARLQQPRPSLMIATWPKGTD